MFHEMTACKMCSADLAMAVAREPLGQSHNFGRTSCNFINGAFAPQTSCGSFRQLHPVQFTCRPGSSWESSGRIVAPRNGGLHKELGAIRERKLSLVLSAPLHSLSRLAGVSLMKRSRKLRSKPEAQLADTSLEGTNRNLEQTDHGDLRRKSDSTTREDSSSDATSPSIATSPVRSEGNVPLNLAVGVGVTAAIIMMAFLGFMAKPRSHKKGSVSDLVKRGQLRSDRGGTRADVLLYEDPFDNPLVKTVKKNPLVKMCGKMFRLAPVTLTEEKVAEHQNRRIQAYRWKRPIVFLNEGDPVPEGVDSEEVRWIPSNHPFATTSAFIDEDLAQKNVYQTRGVPSRVRAEHEALRKKILESAQGEPEIQLPNLDQSIVKTWKSADGTAGNTAEISGNNSQGSDSAVAFSKQEEKP